MLIVALAGNSCAAAVDPPPTFAELLKQYRALGLPLPPEKAKLVRFRVHESEMVDGKLKPAVYWLAFELKPGTKTENPILISLSDLGEWQPNRWDWGIIRFEDTKGNRSALKDVAIDADDALVLATQCHARGWNDLADDLLKSALKNDPKSPLRDWRKMLCETSWSHWLAQTLHPTADRAPVAKRLRELIKSDPDLDKEENRAFLKSLELALVPSKAKPGSTEALIDGLVDYAIDPSSVPDLEKGEPYWSITERGFDAIPALIAHLEDERLTRSMDGFRPRRVRHLVADIIEGLGGNTYSKESATEWWNEVRKGKEEAYLLEHVLPPKPKGDEEVWISGHMIRVLSAKYPKQIPVLYRKVLEKRPELGGYHLSAALLRIPGPAKEKLDLLLEAANHKDRDNFQREPALRAIAQLDKKLFEKLLLARIENIPKEENNWYDVYISELIVEADDPKLWIALEKAAKSASVAVRVELIIVFGSNHDPKQRTERLRLLAGFLDDTDVLSEKDPTGLTGGTGPGEVRNIAAGRLAYLVGVEVEKQNTPAEYQAILRKAVKEELKRTLDKPK